MLNNLIRLAAVPLIASAATSFPTPTFSVSADVRPAQPSISNPWSNTVRPLARAQDDRHQYVDFVANEVILITANESDIQPLLPKSGTNHLLTKALTPKGSPYYPATMYLISIDSSAVSTASLVSDIRKTDANSTGNLLISSITALRTLAFAAHEQASGIKTSLNYVMRPADYGNWTATDSAPYVPSQEPYRQIYDQYGLDGYTADSFQWPYNCQVRHAADPSKCTQDIGVAAAWRGLDFAGKLSNRVNVNIYDSGFAPNFDFPTGFQILPASSTNQPGPGTCEGKPCPFHGTAVTMAGFAVPTNGFGGTGSGGPVANLTMISSPNLDLWAIVQNIWNDVFQLPNTRILNMSFYASIPTPLCLGTCELMDAIGNGLRAAGMLVVAAAGNDGGNVDDSVCLGPLCVETSKTIPCEMSGVLCVGGIAWNSTKRALSSNWGSDSTDPSNGGTVRLFAPFDVFVYDQYYGGNTSNGIYLESGTSLSAPFVAGVAALVWAANPSLGPGDVEKILITTAHHSTDTTVNRYVDAFSAVKTALGGHLAPSIYIKMPAPDQTFHFNQYVTFEAHATDENTGADISNLIQWTSDEPGEGPTQPGGTWHASGFRLDLNHIVHTFTASIAYQGFVLQATVRADITDYPLTLSIDSPNPLEETIHFAGDPINLAYSANHGSRTVAVSDVSWSLENLDAACVSNCMITFPGTTLTIPGGYLRANSEGTPGRYRLFLNCQGQSVSVVLTIYPKSNNPPPTVTISSPLAGQLFYARQTGLSNGRPIYQVTVPLAGSAVDFAHNQITGSNLNWFQDAAVGSGIGMGNTMNYTVTVTMIGTPTAPLQVPIILRATDHYLSSSTATVVIKVVTL